MQIIRQTHKPVSKPLAFALTKSNAIMSMKECVDDSFEVKEWVLYEEEDKKDPMKQQKVLSIMGDDGVIRATNSPTFQEMFLDMVDIMGEDDFAIKIITGESKAGRTFVTCDLVFSE